jgi:hypothetical protein
MCPWNVVTLSLVIIRSKSPLHVRTGRCPVEHLENPKGKTINATYPYSCMFSRGNKGLAALQN